jgi:stage III sporulation protein AA
MKDTRDVYSTIDKEADSLLNFLNRVSQPLAKAVYSLGSMEGRGLAEIRIRTGRPVSFYLGGRELYLTEESRLTDRYESGIIYEKEDLVSIFNAISENSIYAYQDEIRNGYITIRGGHRVGIVGKVVLENGADIKHIKEISGLNIRVAGQIRNCGQKVLPHVIKGEQDIYNTLIVSPPGCGKTTLLRDMTRLLSDGFTQKQGAFRGVNIGVVDERSEIAACFKGVPQNDVGRRTDVLDGCPKALGMLMLLRAMAPQIIVTDEIGGSGDGEAVMNVANAGVRLLTTAHGYCTKGLVDLRKEARDLIREGIFQKIIVLDNSKGPGTVKEIIDLSIGLPELVTAGETEVSGWNPRF